MVFFESAAFYLYSALSLLLITYSFGQNHRSKQILKNIDLNRAKAENSIARREEIALNSVSKVNEELAHFHRKIEEAKIAEQEKLKSIQALTCQVDNLTYRKTELERYIATNDGREELQRVNRELANRQKEMFTYQSGRIIALITCQKNTYASNYLRSALCSCIDVWKSHPGLNIKICKNDDNLIVYWMGSSPESLLAYVKCKEQNQVYFKNSFLMAVKVA